MGISGAFQSSGYALLIRNLKKLTMKKIFITGSTDGLGFMAAEGLIKQGNQVILHARNQNKAGCSTQETTQSNRCSYW